MILIIIFNNYITSLYNALKYNYKKYNKIITKILIHGFPQGHFYNIDNYKLPINVFNYISLNNNLSNIHMTEHLIDNDNLKLLCSSLKNNLNLKVLNLSSNKITDITPLKCMLNVNTNLKVLNLSNNFITDLSPLNIVLKNNNFLQELNIDNPHCIYSYKDNNKILIYTVDNIFTYNGNCLYTVNEQYIDNSNNYQSDLSNIFKVLITNNTLKKLDLGWYVFNDLEYYSLCDMFKVNTSINSFTITNTTNKSAEFNHDCSELFDTLKYNNSIQDLTVNIYKMNKREIKSLSELIKFNTSIKTLTLIKNYTTYIDWFLIYKSLEFNKSIKKLILVNSLLASNETDRRYDLNLLCKSLYFNKKITKIEINDINIKDVDLIVNLLKYNHYITNITLFEYPFFGRNYDINLVNSLRNKMNKLLRFNKTLYNDF